MSKQAESKVCDKCGKRYQPFRVKISEVPYPIVSLICKECTEAEPEVIMGKVVILKG